MFPGWRRSDHRDLGFLNDHGLRNDDRLRNDDGRLHDRLRHSGGSRYWRGRSFSRSFRGLANHRQDSANLYNVVFDGCDLEEDTSGRRWDFGVDLVRADLKQWFIHRDGVTNVFQPPGDGAFGDALAKLRHRDGNRHLDFSSSCPGAIRNCGGRSLVVP